MRKLMAGMIRFISLSALLAIVIFTVAFSSEAVSDSATLPQEIRAESQQATGPIKFAKLLIPDGVTTDHHGNVFVNSLNPNNVFENLISVFSPDGTLVRQIILGAAGKMATEPATGQIWLLSNGQVLSVDSDTLAISPIVNIPDLPVDTSNIYDIAAGLPFFGVINPQLATYGDFTLLRRGNQLDMFVTGHYNAWHFVIHIRFLNQVEQSAKVIVASGASLVPYDNSPHGIAANLQRTVLTTLGWAPSSTEGTVDRPSAFGVDFPEDQRFIPRYVLDQSHVFSSRGMTTDVAGNFYIATGSVGGGTACGGAPSLIIVPSALTDAICHNFTSNFTNPLDVALSPTEEFIYLTDADIDPFNDNDSLWRFSK